MHQVFTVEGPWQTRSIVSVEVVGWWMLYLARAAAGDKIDVIIASPAEMLLKLFWWDFSKYSLAVAS